MKRRAYDDYGTAINELNMERSDGMSDYERMMHGAEGDELTYEQAANLADNAWSEIERGYFGVFAADFDLAEIEREYKRRTVVQAMSGHGWYFEDLPTAVLNALAEKHAVR